VAYSGGRMVQLRKALQRQRLSSSWKRVSGCSNRSAAMRQPEGTGEGKLCRCYRQPACYINSFLPLFSLTILDSLAPSHPPRPPPYNPLPWAHVLNTPHRGPACSISQSILDIMYSNLGPDAGRRDRNVWFSCHS